MTSPAHATFSAAGEADRGIAGPPATPPRRRPLRNLGTALFSAAVMTLLWAGWENRDFHYLTAKNGPGYALGITGGVAMLVLLLYPARKRLRFMRRLGPVKYWFRIHMMLGVLGPTCILYHADFHLGSLNSNIALVCMLMVAGSGLVGRFIYTKIHYGLYGGRASLAQLRLDKDATGGQLAELLALAPRLGARLQAYEDIALAPSRGILHRLTRRFTLGIRTRWTRFRLLRQLRAALRRQRREGALDGTTARRHYRSARRYLDTYLTTVQRITAFSFYERLFSLWHVLHLPLFLMMLVSGIIHVIAVHMY